jgi:hypothetical protein
MKLIARELAEMIREIVGLDGRLRFVRAKPDGAPLKLIGISRLEVLESLDADLLKQHNCFFAGGTAIALRYGEYRESVHMDFWSLRYRHTATCGIQSVSRPFKH